MEAAHLHEEVKLREEQELLDSKVKALQSRITIAAGLYRRLQADINHVLVQVNADSAGVHSGNKSLTRQLIDYLGTSYRSARTDGSSLKRLFQHTFQSGQASYGHLQSNRPPSFTSWHRP
jgi:hypothetical protein